MAQNDYVKLPNQGSIASNLRLLYEMEISSGYADDSGYFTKRDVAEIGANALLITTGAQVGNGVVNTLSTETNEEMNPPLQNAKMRMQILRLLGLVSTDYDSEIYAITRLGRLITPKNPNRRLLLELFMNICSCTEIYEHNCDLKFRCYPGYQICYAFSALDYRISSAEMPVLMTYDIHKAIRTRCQGISQKRGTFQQRPSTLSQDTKRDCYQAAIQSDKNEQSNLKVLWRDRAQTNSC